MKFVRDFLKGVYKSMTNRTAETINAVKEAVIEISKDKNSKEMTSGIIGGIGISFIGLGIGLTTMAIIIHNI